jgi:hypothetical protein
VVLPRLRGAQEGLRPPRGLAPLAKPPKPSKPAAVAPAPVAPAPAPAPAKAPKPAVPEPAAAIPGLRRLLSAASGARLCYGEPVVVDGRTIIPVARVRALGGGHRGGPGGGGLNAEPLGFIDVTADGARFAPVSAPAGRGRIPGRSIAVAAAAGLAAGVLLRRGRRLRPLPR